NHAQPGNPAKLAAGIMTLANSPNPPLRMPFGSDTVAVIEEQHASVEQELAVWRQLALSTDFPSEEVGAEEARLDDRHLDAERFEFGGNRFR
ncbi:hypothetical protein ACC713_36630, partial [Rhizobium johnstonii]